MKSLYIVDYWVPFPQSEYGGVVNLIAGSDAEAFELCADEDGLNHPGYEDRIMPNILKAQKFALVDEYESGIIDAFTTWRGTRPWLRTKRIALKSYQQLDGHL